MSTTKLIKDELQKKKLREALFPGKTPRVKVSPFKPIMEINKDNSLWMSHCVNKKMKNPTGLILDVQITTGQIKVVLTQNGNEIGVGKSKHDINEAIEQVKKAFAVNNLHKFLTSK